MARDTTLITDPNSLFAISRALRKRIVETDPNEQNRNNAIRDEKHLAYKSTGKSGFESFKYDILTSLEQLDNYFLEMETVLGKITEDEKTLAGEVLKTPKKRGRKPKAKVEGAGYGGCGYGNCECELVGGKRCCFNSAYCNGTAHYRNPRRMTGGVLPDLPKDENVFDALRGAIKSDTVSAKLKKIIKFYLPRAEEIQQRYEAGEITTTEYSENLDELYFLIKDKSPELKADKLVGTDEQDALVNIDEAFQIYVDNLPENAPESQPAEAPEVEAPASRKQRRSIPILTGNEFIVSTLSKINTLLIKLIAEYNGKILVNYKKFLQSDLEEIALKVLDSKRRFKELTDYLKDYEQGTKAVNISKFLSTIESNFNRFTALTSRSIANFVNPNAPALLPNFSQQLSKGFEQTFENPTQPFNVYTETQLQKNKKFNESIEKLADEYRTITDAFEAGLETFQEGMTRLEEIQQYLDEIRTNAYFPSIQKSKRYKDILDEKKALQTSTKKTRRKLEGLQKRGNVIQTLPEFTYFPRAT